MQGRQLASITVDGSTYNYSYDGDGIRTQKIVDGVTHAYVTQNGKVMRETIGTGATAKVLDFVYDNNGKPFALIYTNGSASPVTYYYVLNLQGDVVALMTAERSIVAQYAYNAWGELLSVTDEDGEAITSASHIANLNPIRYRGYYYDTETGFYYLQSRYYDPANSRFINADSLANTGQGFVGTNMFAYCGNNPCTNIDSQGMAYEVVGAGIQVDFTGLVIGEGGMEIIIYWNTEETEQNDGPVIAVYIYGGITADTANTPDIEIIKNLLNDNLDSIMANPEKAIKQIISGLTDINISVSGVLLFGNENFKSSKDYEGPFDSYSVNLWHAKAAYATSETCKAVSIGASLKSSFGVSISRTRYKKISTLKL